MFLNIAHRGDSVHAPENTFLAFERAVSAGASAVELDLRCTADGHVVVMHDADLDRTTDGSGAVGRTSLSEISGLDAGGWFSAETAGERVPRLSEVCERLGDCIPLVLHVKDEGRGIEEAIAHEVQSRRLAGRITVSSEHRGVLSRMKSLVPDVTTTWIAWLRDWRWWMWYVAGRVRRLGATRVSPPGSSITPAMVKYFHERGVEVRAWGVGQDRRLARRLIEVGVDGMTYDDPGWLRAELERSLNTSSIARLNEDTK